MFLGYPNTGKVDTYLIEKSCHRSIIRNAACGNNSALVKAVYKDCTLKEFVLVELINEIKKEVRQYAKDTECLLKLKSPEDIRKFSHLSLYHQLLLKCPKFLMMIGSICKPGKVKSLPPLPDEKGFKFINSVCMAASICLHQCNQLLSANHYRTSLLLLNGGAKAMTLERCSHLGISVSHSSAIRMQRRASQGGTKVTTWRDDITSTTLQVHFFEEVLKEQQGSNVVNLSHDLVQRYKYFDESIYNECCSMLHTITTDQSNSVNFTKEDLTSAVQEIKKNIVHFK